MAVRARGCIPADRGDRFHYGATTVTVISDATRPWLQVPPAGGVAKHVAQLGRV